MCPICFESQITAASSRDVTCRHMTLKNFIVTGKKNQTTLIKKQRYRLSIKLYVNDLVMDNIQYFTTLSLYYTCCWYSRIKRFDFGSQMSCFIVWFYSVNMFFLNSNCTKKCTQTIRATRFLPKKKSPSPLLMDPLLYCGVFIGVYVFLLLVFFIRPLEDAYVLLQHINWKQRILIQAFE